MSSYLQRVVELMSLGDGRLEQRAGTMLQSCVAGDQSSLRAMFGVREKEKAAQRFLSNPKVDVLALREAAYALTREVVAKRRPKHVVCAYDPSLLDFSFQSWKSGRASIGDGNGRGYKWLNAVLVDPESRALLGSAHQTLVSAAGPDDAGTLDYAPGVVSKKQRKKLECNPANQFLTIANAVDSRMQGVDVIHVADREFDDALVLRSRRSAHSHFVLRGNGKRVVQVPRAEWLRPEDEWPKSRAELDECPAGSANVLVNLLAERMPLPYQLTLLLDGKDRVCPVAENAARAATLSFGAIEVRLNRRSKRGTKFHLPEQPVSLSLVVVREINPPAGKKPIQWLLLTDLPVATREDIEGVVAAYKCRWRIEEFFRTTKDAMGLEKSELDDPESTSRLLFFVTCKAMLLDQLRLDAEIPAGCVPTKQQRMDLRAGAKAAVAIEAERQKTGKPVPALPRRERARMTLGLIASHARWSGKSNVSLGNYLLLEGLRLFLYDIREGRYAWLLEDVG